MFEKEWFKNAYKLGISWEDFWHMNPRIIQAIADGYAEKKKDDMQIENCVAYLQGRYFMDALMATVGNMFKRRGQKPYQYPESPYDLDEQKSNGELTEEEIEKQRERFAAKLTRMEANFKAGQKQG
jgi:hypothetical protein